MATKRTSKTESTQPEVTQPAAIRRSRVRQPGAPELEGIQPPATQLEGKRSNTAGGARASVKRSGTAASTRPRTTRSKGTTPGTGKLGSRPSKTRAADTEPSQAGQFEAGKIETRRQLAAAAAACEDKKAEDIRILALDPAESGLSDYFLICNGTNDRQNVAITDEIELRLKREFGVYPKSVEGRREGEWVLMDYVDFIVHVFSAEKRAYYGLERLRKSALTLSVEDLNQELKQQLSLTRSRAGNR